MNLYPMSREQCSSHRTVALHGVIQNDYKGGEYVAVLGGGTIGMFTMQWTKIFGAKK